MQKLQCSAAVSLHLGTVYDPSTKQGTWFGAIPRHRSELLTLYSRNNDAQASSQSLVMEEATNMLQTAGSPVCNTIKGLRGVQRASSSPYEDSA